MKTRELTTKTDRTERGYFALLAMAVLLILMGMAAMSCNHNAYSNNLKSSYGPHTCPAYR